MVKWISVEEKLSENWVKVLCFCPELAERDKREQEDYTEKNQSPGVRFGCRVESLNENRVNMTRGYYFTYWMPLPEPPKEASK